MEKCNCDCNCKQPESRPENTECDEKQIAECHGDVKEHPCDTNKII